MKSSFLYTILELSLNADCKSAASNLFSFVNDIGYKVASIG